LPAGQGDRPDRRGGETGAGANRPAAPGALRARMEAPPLRDLARGAEEGARPGQRRAPEERRERDRRAARARRPAEGALAEREGRDREGARAEGAPRGAPG